MVRLAQRRVARRAGEQPDVELLAADDVLEGPVKRAVRPRGLDVEDVRAERGAVIEQRAICPDVVSQDVVEHPGHLGCRELPCLNIFPTPFHAESPASGLSPIGVKQCLSRLQLA